MTFWETIERGEYVMFALAVIVIASVLILWIRSARLAGNRNATRKMMQKVRDYVVEGDVDNALQLCRATFSPGARVIASGLGKMGQTIAEVKDAMAETAEQESHNLSVGTLWLRTFAVVSPLLGLGGTLVGIIDRLRDMGESDVDVTTSMVCEALAPTIVTTVAGLGVGILALIFLTILEGRVGAATRRVEALGNEFLELLNEPA